MSSDPPLMSNDVLILNARIDALQREVAFCLGQIWAATPTLTAMRGPNDNMNRILAEFKEADHHAVTRMFPQKVGTDD